MVRGGEGWCEEGDQVEWWGGGMRCGEKGW